MPKILRFSGTEPTTTTNYLAVVGPNTMWPGAEGRKQADVLPDSRETILIAENQGLDVHWMEPRDLDVSTMDFRVNSPAGISSWYKQPAVVTVDGTVRRISTDMTPETVQAAVNMASDKNLLGVAGWDVLPDGRLRERRKGE